MKKDSLRRFLVPFVFVLLFPFATTPALARDAHRTGQSIVQRARIRAHLRIRNLDMVMRSTVVSSVLDTSLLEDDLLESLAQQPSIERHRRTRRPRTPSSPTNPAPEPPNEPSTPPSDPAPTPPSSDKLASFRARVIELVNQERRKAGVRTLEVESHLVNAAQKHAEDMHDRKYFSHNTPEGKTPTQQIHDADYPKEGSWATAQNIARGQDTPEEVMEDWMNSSGHRKNILNGKFQHIGVGYKNGYWVQDFGAYNL